MYNILISVVPGIGHTRLLHGAPEVWLPLVLAASLLAAIIIGSVAGLLRHDRAVDDLRAWTDVSRGLLNRASIIAVFVKLDGTISFASEPLLELTGYTSAEVTGKNWFDLFVAPDVREEIRAQFQAAWTPEFKYGSDYLIASRDGTRHLIRWLRMILRNPDGSPVGVCSIGHDLTASRADEERILKLKDFYERILENITSGVFVADSIGRVFYANAAMRQRSGLLPHEIGELSGSNPLPRSLAAFRPAYIMARHAREPIAFEAIQLERPDGEQRLESGWMLPLVKDGQFDGMICSSSDVTEQKRTEDDLRANRDMFREIASLSSDWVWECDSNARYTYASSRVRDVLGYLPEEVIGKTACDLAPPDELPNVVAALKPLLTSPRPFFGAQVVGLRRDGARALLEVSGLPIYLDDGALKGFRGVVSDVTEREQQKRELQRLAVAISHAEDIVMVLDRRGLIEYVNPAFEVVSGYSRAEAIGKTVRALLQSDQQPVETIDAMWEQLCRGTTWTGHIINARRDGGVFHVDATISPIFDDEWEVKGFVAVQRDVTEKLALTERLARAVEMERFGNLVSGVAHEVRNPLNAIQAASAALELDFGKEADARELFDIVRSQVDRLAQLMNDLLAIGKPIDPILFQRRSVSELVAEALKLWLAAHPGVREDQVQYSTDSEQAVLVDSLRIHQVLLNVLDNAVQHGGPDFVLKIDVSDVGDGCRIQVRDSGPGVKPQYMDRIFEPFFSTRHGGTGLGLALVKSIVQRHNGTVLLRNNEPEPGCTCEIILPAHYGEAALHES